MSNRATSSPILVGLDEELVGQVDADPQFPIWRQDSVHYILFADCTYNNMVIQCQLDNMTPFGKTKVSYKLIVRLIDGFPVH